MEKLKTLNEIKHKLSELTYSKCGECYKDSNELADELKKEVIEWIKMLENWHKDLSAEGSWVKCPRCNKWFVMLNASLCEEGKEINCVLCKEKIIFEYKMIGPYTEFETKRPEFAIKIFKDFFNIREKDLKENGGKNG